MAIDVGTLIFFSALFGFLFAILLSENERRK